MIIFTFYMIYFIFSDSYNIGILKFLCMCQTMEGHDKLTITEYTPQIHLWEL
jgi:hypothetical protein